MVHALQPRCSLNPDSSVIPEEHPGFYFILFLILSAGSSSLPFWVTLS